MAFEKHGDVVPIQKVENDPRNVKICDICGQKYDNKESHDKECKDQNQV